MKFLALDLLFLTLCAVMQSQRAKNCEKWVCHWGPDMYVLIVSEDFLRVLAMCLPFYCQPISFCPEHPQAFVIQRMCKPYETTSNRRGVLCPGMSAAPTEWNMLKHFLRKLGKSNQASSTSQLCASCGFFLVLLVNKITNTDCLSFKNCMCKCYVCIIVSTWLLT